MHGTYRLPEVPLRVVLLVIAQAEGSVQHRVVHTVVNQTVGLWVETLCGGAVGERIKGERR